MAHLYLPVVQSDGDVASLVADFLALMRSDPAQMRPTLTAHPVLMAVAQCRADDLVARGYMAHTDPDGNGPNWHLVQAGYVLPDYYAQERTANNVESIGGGYPGAINFWTAISTSPRHRDHALGMTDFYRWQIRVGVGIAYREGSTHSPAWVMITCPAP